MEEDCYCLPDHSHGTDAEHTMSLVCQWCAFAFSVILLMFYAYHTWKATCGWEEVYVVTIELIKVLLEIFAETYSPATITQVNNVRTMWLRYGEWLLTCPVILIHLSNITGLKDDYSKRTMRLLVSDIGTIVMGVTAAFSPTPVKITFFCLGLCYGGSTFFTAAKVYIESYHSVPKGKCRKLVKFMAWIFFMSWVMFPLLFLMGPEGFGHLSDYGSIIAHTFADVMSKNLWGLFGHHLRVQIHNHILVHGDIRKKKTVNVAGEDMVIEEFVEEEDDDTIRHSTAHLANRQSFVNMGKQLKAEGHTIRASLDGSLPQDEMEKGTMINGKPAPYLDSGRVILGVPDISMVDFFSQQFSALPAAIELVPAVGQDSIVQITQQAMNLGGCDFVLLHPEFLRDRSPNSLAARLKMAGQRVCAFGWTPMGPMRELIESSGIDGFLEGPSFGAGINLQQLTTLVSQMQMQRKQIAMMQMNQSMNSTMMGQQGMGMMGGQSMGGSNFGSMGGHVSPTNMMANPLLVRTGTSSSNYANSPLYAQGQTNNFNNLSVPTVSMTMATQSSPNSGMARQMSGQMSGGASEADMLQQLMNEISRLKNELGESH